MYLCLAGQPERALPLFLLPIPKEVSGSAAMAMLSSAAVLIHLCSFQTIKKALELCCRGNQHFHYYHTPQVCKTSESLNTRAR